MKMKNLISKIWILSLIILFASCSDWLVLEPENELVHDEFWKSKSEVEGVLGAIYKDYRATVQKSIVWGDARSDVYMVTDFGSGDLKKIKSLDILETNSLCNWGDFYKVINQANAVIKMAPEAQVQDASFSIADLNKLVGEAKFLRSLAYFYLARTFGSVPLVTEPYITDAEPFVIAKSSKEEVLAFIIADLEEAVTIMPGEYEVEWQNKGRATKWAGYSLLADVYLWDEQYNKCTEACDMVINSGNFTLVPGELWFDIFSDGNTDESIFELQYTIGQTNPFYGLFWNKPDYILAPKFYEDGNEVFEELDLRGEYSTYFDEILWKYVGLDNDEESEARGSSFSTTNWIYYRLADIYLMKAEALALTGQYPESKEILAKIRNRAGLTEEFDISENKEDYENFILMERMRELTGEGKRWFDLLRTAKRNNFERQALIVDVLLENVSAIDRNAYEAKLSDPNSYYLPIFHTELEHNNLLEQNPYYQGED